MKRLDKIMIRTALFLSGAALIACSSAPKATLPADANAQNELQKLDSEIQAAREKQYDVLSPKNFDRAVEARNDAEKKIQKGKSDEKALNDIAVGQRAIEDAARVGAANSAAVQPMIEARQNAMAANAHKIKEKDFRKADEDFADMGQDMEKGKYKLNARKFSNLEREYRDLELESRRVTLLGAAKAQIERAEKQGAARKVPRTYQVAKADLTTAERAIASSPRAPAGYNAAVSRANESAAKLAEVADTAHTKDVDESVALQLWNQKQALKMSQAELISAEAQAKADAEKARMEEQGLQSELSARDAALAAEQKRLADLQASNSQYADQEAMKNKIEELRAQFSPEEAEVVKDGKNIVVRLKQMSFTSGRSELSPQSYATLKKVQNLIAAVPAQQVVVEGHTDSTGTDKVNKNLSEKRAESVKQYLSAQGLAEQIKLDAKGYGADRPLKSNKTKEGRATNRRVDVVIETSTVL